MTESRYGELERIIGFDKRQVNKWFWDRKKKESDSIKSKKLSYPGLLWEITNARTGKDLTPSFKRLCPG